VVHDVAAVTAELADRFGPLTAPMIKPYSLSLRTIDNKLLIKVYRGIDPTARQQRELDAVAIAPTLGVSVPEVLDHGHVSDVSWTAFEILAAAAGTATPDSSFLAQVGPVMAALHRSAPGGAGPGWISDNSVGLTNREHLIRQLSVRAQSAPWWAAIAEGLRALDDEPAVYLHGDLKPEHLLTSTGGVWVVDWEASARGAAACDHADAIFHLLRDLIYTDQSTVDTAPVAASPVGLAPALAWRLTIWADRRRPADLDHLPHDVLATMAAGMEIPAAVEATAAVIRRMRRAGTPR
jgi:aminoglycoside phosphotransferase (APT) family kinase protein